MTQTNSYLITVLETIGTPLMAAVSQVCAEDQSIPPETRPQEEAKRVAALVSVAVQVSIELGNQLEIAQAPNIEELRVSLAQVAAGLVADQYRRLKTIPTGDDLQAIYGAAKSVLGFTQSFVLGLEADQRLKALSGSVIDHAGAKMHYLSAFIPVVNVVSSFAFGQADDAFMRSVAEKMTQKARDIVAAQPGDLSEEQRSLHELHMLRALCNLYAESHKEEIIRMSRLDEAQRNAVSPDMAVANVWSNFDRRVAMMQTLTHAIVPGAETATVAPARDVPASNIAPVVPPAAPPVEAPPPAADVPIVSAPVAPEETQAAPPAPPSDPPAAPAQNDPMAAFVKKPKSEEPPAATPAEPLPDVPAASETPLNPPVAISEDPPAAPPLPLQDPTASPMEPPAIPPAEDESDDDGSDDGNASGGGDPMSFFTKKSE